MKSRSTKLIALCLAILCVLSTLVACTGNQNPADSTAAPAGTTAPAGETTTGEQTDVAAAVEQLMQKYNCITIAKAIELSGTTKDVYTAEEYAICGQVTSIVNATYGQMVISDGKNSYEAYGSYSSDGSVRYDAMTEVPVVGDWVVLRGNPGYFNAPQFKKAYIMEFIHVNPTVDDSYKPMSITEARDAADGTALIIEGIVAQITYANGYTPNGFFVTDGVSSIYVYGSNSAAGIKVGNKVKLAGSKTYFIADSEKTNAEKYGYKGCCQIAETTVLENDKAENALPLDWATEITMKEMMNIPFDSGKTTLFFKTTAIINKKPGQGFTNYYINDLDGVTGSYVYTSNNGGDFTWLDQYDGKTCSLILTAINAKSTASGCVYRLIPVKILSDDVPFTGDPNEFVFEYYIKKLVAASYTADPSIELPTTVETGKVGTATVSYASKNTSVATVSTEQGKTLLKLIANGTADIEVAVTVSGQTKTFTITVALETKTEVASITVAEAIAAADDTEVIVKGIVSSGIANQTGFYLIDETGAIAVRCSADTLKTLAMGNLVVVKGKRIHYNKTETCAGQSCINDATIENNFFGEYAYSTAGFKNDLTIAQMIELPVNQDYTAAVYRIEGKLTLYKTQYASTYQIADADGKYIAFYSSSAAQYAWLDEYLDKTVTVDLALCNWNKKSGYKGCVLAVVEGDKLIVNPGNFSK